MRPAQWIGMLLSTAIAVFLVVEVVRSDDTATRIILLIPIALGFGIPAFYIRKSRIESRTRAAGIKAKVKVLRSSEAFGGVTTVNDQPFLLLEVELDQPGHPSRRLRRRMTVPRLAVPDLVDGATFDALVDPKHPDRFVIDW